MAQIAPITDATITPSPPTVIWWIPYTATISVPKNIAWIDESFTL